MMMMLMMMIMMFHYSQVVQGLLRVLVAHLLCNVGQLVCGAYLRGQFTQTTQTVTLIYHGHTLKLQTYSSYIVISLTAVSISIGVQGMLNCRY